MSNEPLVSIGVPVYNDASWLRNALDHLAAQDYHNLEIIIADDGSNDGSRELCREFAQRDGRVRLFENKHNLSALQNHKFVFDVSTGDYFAWGSGHDYYMPSFISRMYETLQANPSVVQCCPKSVYDLNGKLNIPPGLVDTRNLPPVERIKSLLAFRAAGGTADYFYGLYRSDILAKVDIARDTVNTDAIMLAELCFWGEILQINEGLLYKVSTHGPGDVRATRESYRAHLDKIKLSKGTILKEFLPRLNSFIEYMNMIDNASRSAIEKEDLFEVIKTEAGRYNPAITLEIQYFLEYFNAEMLTLKSFSQFRQYRAAQILSVLEQVRLFDFELEGMHELRSICFSELGLNAEARVSVREQSKSGRLLEKMKGTIYGYRYKVADILHKLLGDKVWKLISPALYHPFQSLILIWIAGVMVLYLLLFSPQLYWKALAHLGIADTLDLWRVHVIAFFGLDKGFH